MSEADKEKARADAFDKKYRVKLNDRNEIVPEDRAPGEWRELAYAPIPKGMLVPRRHKEGIQAADVPDCSIPLPSVKAELLRFMGEADIKTPEAAAKWRAVFEAAHMDEYLLEGITDQLARRCTIRAILHLLSKFSMFVKASEGKMSSEEALKMLMEARADNHAQHQLTRLVFEDAILEKRKRGREAQEAETRVQMALDRMEEKIAGSKGQYGGMSPEDAADEVWGEMSSGGHQLRISAKRLSERYRN